MLKREGRASNLKYGLLIETFFLHWKTGATGLMSYLYSTLVLLFSFGFLIYRHRLVTFSDWQTCMHV